MACENIPSKVATHKRRNMIKWSEGRILCMIMVLKEACGYDNKEERRWDDVKVSGMVWENNKRRIKVPAVSCKVFWFAFLWFLRYLQIVYFFSC